MQLASGAIELSARPLFFQYVHPHRGPLIPSPLALLLLLLLPVLLFRLVSTSVARSLRFITLGSFKSFFFLLHKQNRGQRDRSVQFLRHRQVEPLRSLLSALNGSKHRLFNLFFGSCLFSGPHPNTNLVNLTHQPLLRPSQAT